jgi:uncharacterized coiled-coil DUF342 family protein
MYALGRTGGRRSINIWPGFVDGLATLLLVVIFVLMVFMIAQYFLTVALSGRDLALQQLREEVSSLANLLSLERADNAELRINVAQLSAELQTSIEARDALSSQLATLSDERESLLAQVASLMSERDDLSGRVSELDEERASLAAQLAALSARVEEVEVREAEAARLAAELAEAYSTIEADREKVETLIAEIAILESLRDEVTAKLLAAEQALEEQRTLSDEQKAALLAAQAQAADRDDRLKQLRLRLTEAEESAISAQEKAAAQTKLSEAAQRKASSTRPMRRTSNNRSRSPISAGASTSRSPARCRSWRDTVPNSSAACAKSSASTRTSRSSATASCSNRRCFSKPGRPSWAKKAASRWRAWRAPSWTFRKRFLPSSIGSSGWTATPTTGRLAPPSSRPTGSSPRRGRFQW